MQEQIRDNAAADVLQTVSARLKEETSKLRALNLSAEGQGIHHVGRHRIEKAQMEYDEALKEYDSAQSKFALRTAPALEQRVTDIQAQAMPSPQPTKRGRK